jgi:hypothetical protein
MGYIKEYNLKIPLSGGFQPTSVSPIRLTVKIGLLTLSSAQLASMFTTPISILPAPTPNRALIPFYCTFVMYAGSVAFTGGGAVNLQYHTNTSIAPFASTVPASVVTEATPGTYPYYLDPTAGFAPPLVDGIDVTNASAPFAAGNGSAKLYVSYIVLTT